MRKARSCLTVVSWLIAALFASPPLTAETFPTPGITDPRIRVASYDPDQVYRLFGYVGYHIHLRFEPGEIFLGVGSGDTDGLTVDVQNHHLFLKPKVPAFNSNVTVLTNLREYHFQYTANWRRPGPAEHDLIYSLRFTYPEKEKDDSSRRQIDAQLTQAPAARSKNIDYWFRGHDTLKPVAASDDGIHTRLRFPGSTELPAIFVRNDDQTESLLNFSIDNGDIIIHRIARQLILRRGKLTACIVNKAFTGTSDRLDTGTIAPTVERAAKEPRP